MINTRIGLSLLSIVATLAMMAGATFAFFTDTDTSAQNTFAAGTLNINIDENQTGFIPFNETGMFPGSEVTRCGGVSNDGSLPFNWHFSLLEITPTPTVNLNDVLQAKIELWEGDGVPSEAVCTSDEDTNDWLHVFNGFVSEASSPDKMGELAAGETAYFRLTASLPEDLVTQGGVNVDDNDYQNGSAKYRFKVDAFQIGDPSY